MGLAAGLVLFTVLFIVRVECIFFFVPSFHRGFFVSTIPGSGDSLLSLVALFVDT